LAHLGSTKKMYKCSRQVARVERKRHGIGGQFGKVPVVCEGCNGVSIVCEVYFNEREFIKPYKDWAN
jgi:hypothetical protein